jgi:hypothetical protein
VPRSEERISPGRMVQRTQRRKVKEEQAEEEADGTEAHNVPQRADFALAQPELPARATQQLRNKQERETEQDPGYAQQPYERGGGDPWTR